MPLRDHFRPPVSRQASWEGFHGLWPATMVEDLVDKLPPGYVAEPRVHLGSFYELDVSTFETGTDVEEQREAPQQPNGGAATYAPPAPTLVADAEIPEPYEYEVLIYDSERERKLVAAVEIVSPANKDRPESRQLFAAKCATLLQKGVCVSIVDVVTIRRFNLYGEVLTLAHCADPSLGSDPASIYAVTCRKRISGGRTQMDTWFHPLALSERLPSLPIWLSARDAVELNLEKSYEEACRLLRIP